MTGYVGSTFGSLKRKRRMWGCNLSCAGNWTACGSLSAMRHPFQKSRLFSRLNSAWLLGRARLSLDDRAKVTKPPACIGSLLLVEAPKATADDEDHRITFGRIPRKTARGRLSNFMSSAQHSLIDGKSRRGEGVPTGQSSQHLFLKVLDVESPFLTLSGRIHHA